MQNNEQQPLWIQDWIKKDFSQAIEQAIENAEKKCALDFFPVVVKSSTTLGHIFPLLTLLLFAVYVSALTLIPLPKLGLWGVGVHGMMVLIMMILAYSLSENLWLARWLTAKKDQRYSVEQAARLAYYEHAIDQHPSVLIFVSLMERQVVVLCNEKVQAKLKGDIFKDHINKLLPLLKRKQLQQALCQCIAGLANSMQQAFPLQGEKPKNALSNKVLLKKPDDEQA
ncbi:MAG TPA: hypothetical protein PKC21_07600 [Oligoflexia bacterium]|nr:hypothetical protein [Oligoflexia bacterium]HMR25201.1 hypothetical protein [Oligoflexia bacterium]